MNTTTQYQREKTIIVSAFLQQKLHSYKNIHFRPSTFCSSCYPHPNVWLLWLPTDLHYGATLQRYNMALQHGAVTTACDTGAGQEEMWFDLIKPSTTCKLRVLVNFKSENIIRFIKIGRFSSHRMNITHYNYTAKQTLYFFHDVCESRFF